MLIPFQSQTSVPAPGDLCFDPGTSAALVTFQSQTRCQAPGDRSLAYKAVKPCAISISDEMPGPWRHHRLHVNVDAGTIFQSQTRCQAPGDAEGAQADVAVVGISISDEMPGPWRRQTHNYKLEARKK